MYAAPFCRTGTPFRRCAVQHSFFRVYFLSKFSPPRFPHHTYTRFLRVVQLSDAEGTQRSMACTAMQVPGVLQQHEAPCYTV